jgi:hypothetical protein
MKIQFQNKTLNPRAVVKTAWWVLVAGILAAGLSACMGVGPDDPTYRTPHQEPPSLVPDTAPLSSNSTAGNTTTGNTTTGTGQPIGIQTGGGGVTNVTM